MIIDGDKIKASSGNTIFIPTGYILKGTDNASIYSPGSIIQVQSTTLTTVFSTSPSAGTFASVTGLSVSITPKFTTSKIYVSVNISGCCNSNAHARVTRNSTPVGVATGTLSSRIAGAGSSVYNNGDTNSTKSCVIEFSDSPSSTSALTYQVQVNGNGSTYFVNQSVNDSDANTTGRYISSITVMEIAQ